MESNMTYREILGAIRGFPEKGGMSWVNGSPYFSVRESTPQQLIFRIGGLCPTDPPLLPCGDGKCRAIVKVEAEARKLVFTLGDPQEAPDIEVYTAWRKLSVVSSEDTSQNKKD